MAEDVLKQQIAYYRARASEYDEWFYREGRYNRDSASNRAWFDEIRVVTEALGRFGVSGDVLELASGTGGAARAAAPAGVRRDRRAKRAVFSLRLRRDGTERMTAYVRGRRAAGCPGRFLLDIWRTMSLMRISRRPWSLESAGRF